MGEVQASDSHELLLLRLAWVRVVGVVLQPLLEHFDRAGRESAAENEVAWQEQRERERKRERESVCVCVSEGVSE